MINPLELKQTTQLLRTLVGNVEWIELCNVRGGLDIVFRVDGELRGLRAYTEEHGRINADPRDFPPRTYIVVKPLPRERILSAAVYVEMGDQSSQLLTNAEREEWEQFDAAEQQKQEIRKREQQEREEARERAEYERLRGKFGGSK